MIFAFELYSIWYFYIYKNWFTSNKNLTTFNLNSKYHRKRSRLRMVSAMDDWTIKERSVKAFSQTVEEFRTKPAKGFLSPKRRNPPKTRTWSNSIKMKINLSLSETNTPPLICHSMGYQKFEIRFYWINTVQIRLLW